MDRQQAAFRPPVRVIFNPTTPKYDLVSSLLSLLEKSQGEFVNGNWLNIKGKTTGNT